LLAKLPVLVHCMRMNKNEHPTSIDFLLKRPGSHLAMLKMNAEIHQERSLYFTQLLPPELSLNCFCSDLTGGLLTVFVPNPSVASILRFEEYELLKKIKDANLFPNIKRIKFKVNLSKKKTNHLMTKKQRERQPDISKLLIETSKTFRDKNLKKSFQQLASHLSDSPELGQK